VISRVWLRTGLFFAEPPGYLGGIVDRWPASLVAWPTVTDVAYPTDPILPGGDMSFDLSRSSLAPLMSSPALTLLALAAGAARDGSGLDDDTRQAMRLQVDAGVLGDFTAADGWPQLAAGLMGEKPSAMFGILRACGALARLLPEVDALFGQAQIAPDNEMIDIGEHQCRVLDLLAAQGAPLAVRVAGLLYNLGKADSPPQHLPAHYQHVERCLPRIEAIVRRFRLSPEIRELAVLTAMELERVHRAAPMRAASIVALLERVDAFGCEARYRQLLLLCTSDYRAYPGNADRVYAKFWLLERARAACLALAGTACAEDGQDDHADAAVSRREARAMAVAAALRSERWADAVD